jgi:hypothetical protein
MLLSGCTHITRKVSPEEESAIKKNFTNLVKDYVTRREIKEVLGFRVVDFEQTANDEVVVQYEMQTDKPLEGGEKAHSTFVSSVRLKQGADGVWNAVEMKPDNLTLEFVNGLKIHAPKTPAPPAVK